MIQITTIKGLSECCPEIVEGTADWYFCKEGRDSLCDLYEAEEIINAGDIFSGMNCHLIHYPEGTVHSPFDKKENVYVEAPVWDDGTFYYLVVDFNRRQIQIHSYEPESRGLKQLACLPLEVAEDCYNLALKVSPLMLCRAGNDRAWQILWPETKTLNIGELETFLFRDEDNLYFSEWEETPDYREYVIVRDLATGRIKERFAGYLCRLPGQVYWRI